jgi:hypothetical protein
VRDTYTSFFFAVKPGDIRKYKAGFAPESLSNYIKNKIFRFFLSIIALHISLQITFQLFIMKKPGIFKSLSHFACAVSLIFASTFTLAQPTSQTFNASGTYTVPAGYSAIATIEAWGAGAGGGAGNGAKGGGGGGAYASSTTTLTAGSYTVTVGTGGTAAGTNGGNSSFTTIVVAEGGFSTTTVTGGAGGTTAGSTGTTKIAGTAGATTGTNNGGAGGAGANGGGAGGTGGPANNGPGGAGTAPGGGGGGKAGPGNSSTAGGVGGDGRVIVTVNSVLPVKISNIKASEKPQGIQIEWITYAESNMEKYIVERSIDGMHFNPIGEIASLNSSTEKKYTFLDINPVPGLSFYQIRYIGFDGKSGISEIVRVNLDKRNKDIVVYPNPVQNGLLYFQGANLAKGNYEVRIFNSAGQRVYFESFEHSGGALTQSIPLPTASIKPGLYTLQLDIENVRVASKTFMVK